MGDRRVALAVGLRSPCSPPADAARRGTRRDRGGPRRRRKHGDDEDRILLREPGSYIYLGDAHPNRMTATYSIHDPIRTQK